MIIIYSINNLFYIFIYAWYYKYQEERSIYSFISCKWDLAGLLETIEITSISTIDVISIVSLSEDNTVPCK